MSSLTGRTLIVLLMKAHKGLYFFIFLNNFLELMKYEES